jgi:hypothetical protein
MTDPGRVARHWLAIAVATLWVVALAGECEPRIAVETVGELPSLGAVGSRAGKLETGSRKEPKRLHRVFVRGLAELTAAWMNRTGLPPWCLNPEPWPEPWHDVPTVTEEEFCLRRFYP